MNKIIPKFQGYKEGSQKNDIETMETGVLIYQVAQDENIRVLLWERYPSYDIIFGVPEKDNWRHRREIGFYVIRREGQSMNIGHYFDIEESRAMAEGFTKIIEESKTNSPDLWNQKESKA
jgi:hypothetical protein